MKQTAVEWLEKEIENISIQVFDGFLTFTEFMEQRENLCDQAKKMEKKQCQDYAIEFALWCDENVYEGDSYIKALEQFKKEKGL